MNHVDLSADTTFAIENVEEAKYLACNGTMTAAFVIKCGITDQDYLLTFAMAKISGNPAVTLHKAYVHIETLPEKYDFLVVRNRYFLHVPQPIEWDLCIWEGYGPVLECEVSVDGALILLVILKCEEDRNMDTYKLHVRCTQIFRTHICEDDYYRDA